MQKRWAIRENTDEEATISLLASALNIDTCFEQTADTKGHQQLR